MARIVKTADERRSELIATAQQLFYTKGYESTSVSDIVNKIGVAQGTFYYYFDSKTAVLEAIVDELITQVQTILEEIVADETLPAIPKWRQAFQVIGNWKVERKEEMIKTLRLIMSDDNVLLQHKLQKQSAQMTARQLARIIAQGDAEGVFTVQFIPEFAEMIIAIYGAIAESVTNLVLNPDKYDNPVAITQHKLTAVQTAIERLLGAPSGSLPLVEENTLLAWFTD